MTADLFDALSISMGGGHGLRADAGRSGLRLEDSAGLVGHYRWMEHRLFETLGGWVTTEPVTEARLFYDVQSQQHQWHAALWEERLPVLDGFDPEQLTAAPTSEIDRLFSLLARGASAVDDRGPDLASPHAGGTLLRLAGLGRVVLPRLIAGYSLHLQRATDVSDAPVIRALELVIRDEIQAWRTVEAMLQSLVRRPHDLAVVTAHQQALETLALGVPGLVPWSAGETAPAWTPAVAVPAPATPSVAPPVAPAVAVPPTPPVPVEAEAVPNPVPIPPPVAEPAPEPAAAAPSDPAPAPVPVAAPPTPAPAAPPPTSAPPTIRINQPPTTTRGSRPATPAPRSDPTPPWGQPAAGSPAH